MKLYGQNIGERERLVLGAPASQQRDSARRYGKGMRMPLKHLEA